MSSENNKPSIDKSRSWVPTALLTNFDKTGITPVDWYIASVLIGRAREGKCWPSIASLEQTTRLSRSTIQRHLRRLEAAGWITTTLTDGRATTYSVTPLLEFTLEKCDTVTSADKSVSVSGVSPVTQVVTPADKSVSMSGVSSVTQVSPVTRANICFGVSPVTRGGVTSDLGGVSPVTPVTNKIELIKGTKESPPTPPPPETAVPESNTPPVIYQTEGEYKRAVQKVIYEKWVKLLPWELVSTGIHMLECERCQMPESVLFPLIETWWHEYGEGKVNIGLWEMVEELGWREGKRFDQYQMMDWIRKAHTLRGWDTMWQCRWESIPPYPDDPNYEPLPEHRLRQIWSPFEGFYGPEGKMYANFLDLQATVAALKETTDETPASEARETGSSYQAVSPQAA